MNEDERESLPQPLVRLCRLLARRRLAHGPDLPLAPALEDELAALVERHFRLPGPLVEAGLAGLADVEVETELEPLSCWLEPQLGPTGLLSGRRPQALVALAAGLDVLGREEHGLLGLVPGHWLATGDGRAVPDWPQVQQLLSPIRLGQRRLSPEQREQRSHLHPALARELPPRLCVHTALRFSFALFLLETLAPLHGRDLRSLLAQLELLRGLEPQLPPEVPYLLHEVLLAAALEAPCPADGCRALAEELLTVLRAT
ncbi:MAG: hypothetical protein FJ125_06225, partial [Deltaproteobacteria bacterium]|nr:hypothetical protein [Deltaproteobacteria bacterium]